MSTTITIHCDRCRTKLIKADHTYLVFGYHLLGKVTKLDLCRDCSEECVLGPLGLSKDNPELVPKNGHPYTTKVKLRQSGKIR